MIEQAKSLLSKENLKKYDIIVTKPTEPNILKIVSPQRLESRLIIMDNESLSLASPVMIVADDGDEILCAMRYHQDIKNRKSWLFTSCGNQVDIDGDIDSGLLVIIMKNLAMNSHTDLFRVTLIKNISHYISDRLLSTDLEILTKFDLVIPGIASKKNHHDYLEKFKKDRIERPPTCERPCFCKKWAFCKNSSDGFSCNAIKGTCHGCCGA